MFGKKITDNLRILNYHSNDTHLECTYVRMSKLIGIWFITILILPSSPFSPRFPFVPFAPVRNFKENSTQYTA